MIDRVIRRVGMIWPMTVFMNEIVITIKNNSCMSYKNARIEKSTIYIY